MGNKLSSFWSKFFTKKEAKILMLGLDAAGKTTILYQLKLGMNLETIPTMGFVYEKIEHKNFKLSVWDVAGQDALRPLWKHYYQNTKGIIFVVDSSDEKRMSLAKEELHKILNDEEIKDAVLLLLANKMDITAMKPQDIENRMEVDKFQNRKTKTFGVVGLTGEGLNEAMDWLADNM